ncbi:MAG: hypothetical protein AAB610_00890 [Patescibacteria group bacterium]
MKKKKIYIGCALSSLSLEDRTNLLENISKLKEKIKDSFEILEFFWVRMDPSKATPEEVYRVDIEECVMVADCMLAICDYPSLGLGYEMATAIEKRGIPVLAVAHKNSMVSKLITGVNHKNFKFVRYDSFDEVFQKVIQLLQ